MFSDLRWIKYKSVGTDQGLRVLYLRWEFFNAVKKLDLQFSLVLLATGFVFFNGNSLELTLLGINILLLFLELGWAVLGKAAIRNGSICYAVIFIILSIPYVAYVCIITALSLDPAVDAFNAVKTLNAETEVLVLLFCGVINRLFTVGCMISMMLSFHSKSYADLKEFFRQKKTKFIPLGLRPPPVPICGCDRSRCLAVCGTGCANCCCDKANAPTGWGSSGGGSPAGMELSELPSGSPVPAGAAVSATGRVGLDAEEALAEAAARMHRESFTAAYLAAHADVHRVDLPPSAPRTASAAEHAPELPATPNSTAAVSFAGHTDGTLFPAGATPSDMQSMPDAGSGSLGSARVEEPGLAASPDRSVVGDSKRGAGGRRKERLDARRAKRREEQSRV
jgi:hypothetical protein